MLSICSNVSIPSFVLRCLGKVMGLSEPMAR